MASIDGDLNHDGSIDWKINLPIPENEFIVMFRIYCNDCRSCFRDLEASIAKNKIRWLVPIPEISPEWLIDLDELRTAFPDLAHLGQVTGRHWVTPVCNQGDDDMISDSLICFHVNLVPPSSARKGDKMSTHVPPAELKPFLQRFHTDHPHSDKCGFVMMRFTPTPLHSEVFAAVQESCRKYEIEALRADAHAYSDELLSNIRTYMHGCGFGIAIFEWIVTDDFNPNVSLEVGYMMGMGKPVCLLKDQYLQALHTDLVGRLYQSFDPQHAKATVGEAVERWLKEKRII